MSFLPTMLLQAPAQPAPGGASGIVFFGQIAVIFLIFYFIVMRPQRKQQKELEKAITGFDVVITTALVPGRPAPRLVTAAAVEGMKPGSVVVDLAGETGGNCELTEPGQTAVKHGVTIASPLNLPATMPEHASELYSKNVTALLDLIVKDGVVAPDFADEVIAASCVTRNLEGDA